MTVPEEVWFYLSYICMRIYDFVTTETLVGFPIWEVLTSMTVMAIFADIMYRRAMEGA